MATVYTSKKGFIISSRVSGIFRMSAVGVNDENCAVIPAEKHSSLCQDRFFLDQPTGRSSILRQTENLPSKTMPKGAKVCFQTPRRDPVTKRILSPSNSINITHMEENMKVMESLNLDKSDILLNEPTELAKQAEPSSLPDDDMPIQSSGGYRLDFDNLDAMNPFQGSKKMTLSPVRPVVKDPLDTRQTDSENILQKLEVEATLDDTLPFVENSLGDVSGNISSTDSSVVTVNVAKVPEMEEQDLCTAPVEKKSVGMCAIDPFQTAGGSLSGNLPPTKGEFCILEPPEEKKPADVTDAPEEKMMPVQLDMKPTATVAPVPAETAKSEPADVHVQGGPIKLEFNFGDASEIKRKMPPKKLGKRSTDVKHKEGKPASDAKPSEEAAVEAGPNDAANVPTSQGSYPFDSKMFEDPNLNPFSTKTKIANSPKSNIIPSPVLREMAASAEMKDPEEEGATASENATEMLPPAEPHQAAMGDHVVLSEKDLEDGQGSQNAQVLMPLEQQSLMGSLEFNEEFVPGTMFMANDFDGQIDYLEQFGSSSFKESALRKQSLYLKFDPLLSESPKKSAGPAAQLLSAAPPGLASRLNDAEKGSTEGAQKDVLKLVEDAAAPPPILQSFVPPFPKPADAEEAIIDVLKYSQKDLDAAITKVQAEAKEKEEQWSAKLKKLQDHGQEMRKVIAEFELLIANMNANQEKQREEAQKNLNKALMEKEQVSSDLNAMERSFGELFKRLEKYKEVVEGYKKNEEVLKACAQDYLTRMKKGEQRYQTLKAHAEEKINLANEEIAEVRSKNKAEISALQAQLRREQLKIQSLEKSLDQKVSDPHCDLTYNKNK
ncbi:hypothetical protein CHARACLAT_005149 [Characodon lateralis]|uniref:Transforming acidic coiled-coil-containing protein C-terminal domain-containing protein n=1 Tax=Characodon lateralis TaxID=208331 RepID=A0ABU7F1C4_9TELE|nr:hypothetical protein [Characodon lateralis]